MVIELKKGYTIESYYDKFTDSYITRLLDPERNQIRDALYSGDMVGRNYDIQSIRDYFKTYMNDPNFNTEPVEDFEEKDSIQEQPVDEEQLEESLITESVGQLYVYHATDNRNIDSINKSGLLINSGTGNWEKMYCEGKVFLALSAEVALDYVEAQENVPDNVVLLKIPADIFEYQYVGYDWNNRCEYHEDINSFTYSKNIPIDYLQVCDPENEPYQDINNFKGTDIGEKILEVFEEECETNMELDEVFDPEIEKRARRTRKATRKTKLPALSKMSPIMPDYGAGIDKFNSFTADGNSGMASTTGSTGLGEAYVSRDELIRTLKNMGFKYKFDKYSDKQLFRIVQERQKALQKKEAEKKKQEYEDAYEKQKRENSSDSYFRDGIEFESEDAARDYFGESIENKFYLNEMIRRGSMKRVNVDCTLRMRGNDIQIPDTITTNEDLVEYICKCLMANRVDLKLWDVEYEDIQSIFDAETNELIYESKDAPIENFGEAMEEQSIKINEKYRVGKKIASDRLVRPTESLESMNNKNKNESMNKKFYINDMHIAWDLEEDYDVKKKQLTESLVIEDSLESKAAGILQAIIEADPDDAISMLIGFYMRDPELDEDEAEDLAQAAYENNDLIDELIWQLDNAGELKEFVDENTFYEGLKVKHNFRTMNEAIKHFEHKHFDETCEDLGLGVLYESMRDRLSSDDIKQLGAFMNHAQSPDEVLTYMKGLLSDDKDGNTKIKNESLVEEFEDMEPEQTEETLYFNDWNEDELREYIYDNLTLDEFNNDNTEMEYTQEDFDEWVNTLEFDDLVDVCERVSEGAF